MTFHNFTVMPVDRLQNDLEKCRFLQTEFWSQFKCNQGWQKLFVNVSFDLIDDKGMNNGNICVPCSILIRKLAKIFHIAYVPMGLDITKYFSLNQNDYFMLLKKFSKELKKLLPKNTITIRFDPPIDFLNLEDREKGILNLKKIKGLKKTHTDIQPPDTVLLDITQDTVVMLQNMKSKWRYNINLAIKKGVEIRQGSIDDIDIFYNLYEETSKRDGIALHSKKYYKDLFQLCETQGESENIKISLYIASHDGEDLAAIITLFSKNEAVYLYGASNNIKRNFMPTYLLQWKAIQDAKEYGSKVYDFYGIPPTDDENHPMHGLYRFKTGFGGVNIHRIGSVDAPLSFMYKIYICLENLRAYYYKKIKKLLVGR